MEKKSPISTDLDHYRRLQRYARHLEAVYQKYVEKISNEVSVHVLTPPGEKVFNFDDYPLLKKRVNEILRDMTTEVQAIIQEGTRDEWMLAVQKNDQMISEILKNSKLTDKQTSQYYQRNLEALKTFQQRKIGGMSLSQRVWKYTRVFRSEMELALDVGLGEGKSAAGLSRDVRKFLKEPDMLFRRVRDKRGNLVLSQRAKTFNPGRGVYRSSFKNALRLTQTEINMAYRESDYQRMQQFDFIVGYEVSLSARHPVYDICDELKGKYPKGFKFRGWHPKCLCHVKTILVSPEEMNKMERAILNGEDPKQVKSRNEVRKLPENFHNWVEANKERVAHWKSTPYFIQDNFKNGDINEGLDYK